MVEKEVSKVSVVITCYNYENFIGASINSVLNQTYRNIEVVIVDDGSTDGSAQVIKQFLSVSKVRYFFQENAGQAKAKNCGIAESTGDFIAFLDADDIWETTKLEKQIALFSNPQVGVVYSDATLIDENGGYIGPYYQGMRYLIPRKGRVLSYLFFDNFIPFSSSIVRKSLIKNFDETLAMGIDWDLWLHLSLKCEFDYVALPLLRYRVGHSGQMSKNRKMRQHCSDIIIKKFLSENKDKVSNSTIRKMQNYTFFNRGKYNYKIDEIMTSSKCYVRAILAWPFDFFPYKGLIRNLFHSLGLK